MVCVSLIRYKRSFFSDMNEIGRQRRKKRKRKENWKQKRRQWASAATVTPTTATRGHSSSRRWRTRPRTRSTFAASAKSSSFYLGQRTVLLWYLSSSSPWWRAGTWGTWTWTRWPTRFRLSQNLQDLLVLLKKIRMWLRGYIPYNKVMTKKLHFKIYYYS